MVYTDSLYIYNCLTTHTSMSQRHHWNGQIHGHVPFHILTLYVLTESLHFLNFVLDSSDVNHCMVCPTGTCRPLVALYWPIWLFPAGHFYCNRRELNSFELIHCPKQLIFLSRGNRFYTVYKMNLLFYVLKYIQGLDFTKTFYYSLNKTNFW